MILVSVDGPNFSLLTFGVLIISLTFPFEKPAQPRNGTLGAVR